MTDDAFQAAMAGLGPFEARPHLGVGVSGGGDSMALVLLADRWARRRGGRVTALTVDHGLRPDSGDEAHRVGRWMADLGMAHAVLPWTGAKPRSGVQAAARRARYDLMEEWSRRNGVLHLLLGHTQEDQAETFLMRLERGSGIDGLAAMSAVLERPSVRLLRPLLGVSRAALRGSLEAAGQAWIEDPSNRDTAYARVRLRDAAARLAEAGLTSERLAATTRRLGQARVGLEGAVAALLASACRIHPAGYAILDARIFANAEADLSARAVARIILCIGGASYGPRWEKLERLVDFLSGPEPGGSRTLGGCLIIADQRGWLVCREGRAPPPPVAAVPGSRLVWDRRFVIDLEAAPGSGAAHLLRLGSDGWAEIVAERPDLRQNPIPTPVRPSLPALGDRRGILAVPHLGYKRSSGGDSGVRIKNLVFSPPNAAAGAGFHLAPTPLHAIS